MENYWNAIKMKKLTMTLTFIMLLSLCGCQSTADFEIQTKNVAVLTYFAANWQGKYGSRLSDVINTLSLSQNNKEHGEYIYSEESDIKKIGLDFSLENISPSGATLVFNQYDADAPTGELIYSDDFVIELLKGGKWEEAPITIEGEYGFNAIAIRIAAGDKTENYMKWEWIYGELAPGEYRISKSILDFRKSGDYDKYTIYANFAVY